MQITDDEERYFGGAIVIKKGYPVYKNWITFRDME